MAERFCCARWTSGSACWRVSGGVFMDGRNQALVEHSIPEMVSQRVYGLALGYEDLNDHEQLRTDPVFGILAGKQDMAEPLAGKSTLNRMELGTGINNRYKEDHVLEGGGGRTAAGEYLHRIARRRLPPRSCWTWTQRTCALHGKQEGRFFHGYYDSYCYLPLYVFCGDHVLCARMRESQSRCRIRLSAGDRAHCEADPCGVAGGEDRFAREIPVFAARNC